MLNKLYYNWKFFSNYYFQQVDQPIKDELTRYAKQLHELHDTSVQNMKSAVVMGAIASISDMIIINEYILK